MYNVVRVRVRIRVRVSLSHLKEFVTPNGKKWVMEERKLSYQFGSEEKGLGIIIEKRDLWSGAPRKVFTKLAMHAMLYFPQRYNTLYNGLHSRG